MGNYHGTKATPWFTGDGGATDTRLLGPETLSTWDAGATRRQGAMLYFVILTKECNLLCSYCGGGSDTPPKEIGYSIDELKDFLAGDDDPVVEFYGGEPLLRLRQMEEIVKAVPGRFLVQTNGLFLDRMDIALLSRFHSILVSIDGKRQVTDRERGKGVYDRVMRNSRTVRQRGFHGDMIARMTVVQGSDIRENVKHLLDAGPFDHVHWQLSFSMFWKGEGSEPGLQAWLEEYNSGVSELVSWWVGEMERTGRVPGIVPFIGVTRSLLTGTRARLRCGSGEDSFTVMPDGRLSACPVSVDFDFSMSGSLAESTPTSLRHEGVGEPCTSCEVYGVCGGRCLFVNRAQEMLREGAYRQICGTVKHLVAELDAALPRIKDLVGDGRVRVGDFEYPQFNNGCEVIP